MKANNLNEIFSNELSNAEEKDKWLIKLLYYLNNIDEKYIIWSNTSISGGIIASFLGVAIAKELNEKIEIQIGMDDIEGLPYDLNGFPTCTTLKDLDPNFSEKAVVRIEDSLSSLSEDIKTSCKLFIGKIEWDINHYKLSKKNE